MRCCGGGSTPALSLARIRPQPAPRGGGCPATDRNLLDESSRVHCSVTSERISPSNTALLTPLVIRTPSSLGISYLNLISLIQLNSTLRPLSPSCANYSLLTLVRLTSQCEINIPYFPTSSLRFYSTSHLQKSKLQDKDMVSLKFCQANIFLLPKVPQHQTSSSMPTWECYSSSLLSPFCSMWAHTIC